MKKDFRPARNPSNCRTAARARFPARRPAWRGSSERVAGRAWTSHIHPRGPKDPPENGVRPLPRGLRLPGGSLDVGCASHEERRAHRRLRPLGDIASFLEVAIGGLVVKGGTHQTSFSGDRKPIECLACL